MRAQQVIEFHINDVVGFPARVTAVVRRGPTVQATIELAAPDWERVDALMLFHLDDDQRNPGSVSGTQPVELVIVLNPMTTDELDGVPDDSLVDALVNTPADSPLRIPQNWYAIEVTEQVDLPPGAPEGTELRSGFTLAWADALG